MTPSGYRRLTLDEQVATGILFLFSFCFVVGLLLCLFVPSVYRSAVLLSSSLSLFIFVFPSIFLLHISSLSLFSLFLSFGSWSMHVCLFSHSSILPVFSNVLGMRGGACKNLWSSSYPGFLQQAEHGDAWGRAQVGRRSAARGVSGVFDVVRVPGMRRTIKDDNPDHPEDLHERQMLRVAWWRCVSVLSCRALTNFQESYEVLK